MSDKNTRAFLEQCAQHQESIEMDQSTSKTNNFVAPLLTEVDIDQITSGGGSDVSTTAAAIGLGLSAIV